MYKKRYDLKELDKVIKEEIGKGREFIELEELLFGISFEPLDVNMFYIKNVKHRLRYEREIRN